MALTEFVGGMPLDHFFTKFLPCDEYQLKKKLDSLPPGLFNVLPSTGDIKEAKSPVLEDDDEEDFSDELSAKISYLKRAIAQAEKDVAMRTRTSLALIELLNSFGLCPGVSFTNSSGGADSLPSSGRQWRPHVSGYKGQQPTSNLKSPDFNMFLLPIEILPSPIQLFPDAPTRSDTETRQRRQVFLSDSASDDCGRIRPLDRLSSVMAEICACQFRTHVFTIIFHAAEVLFLRADRADVIVSEAIDYRTNSRGLVEFFWRFSQASDSQRGVDSTVQSVSLKEVQTAKEKLARWKPQFERPVVKVDVPDTDGTVRQVLAWGTLSSPESLTGRGTRAIPVWDLRDNAIRFLKDFWRAEHLEKESDILGDLHAKKVQNIPRIFAGGDLYDPNNPSSHRTITQDYVDADWRTGSIGTPTCSLDVRIHHRILEDFFPESILQCRNAKEMVLVIRDALIAHRDAFKAGVLHRDISSNNVLMIRDNGGIRGILADWDLAMRFKEDSGTMVCPEALRQHSRTGTWYFMSALLLRSIHKAHTVQDDLESFFHLVLYLSLHWFPYDGPTLSLQELVDNVFGQSTYTSTTDSYFGGSYKQLMIEERDFIKRIKFSQNESLTFWIDDWLEALQEFYLSRKFPQDPDRQLLQDHSWILSRTNECLHRDGWSPVKKHIRRTEDQNERPASEYEFNHEGATDDSRDNQGRSVSKPKADDPL